jgi:hypothetical protein
MHPFSTTLRHTIRQSCVLCWAIFLLFLIFLCVTPQLLADSSHFSPPHSRIATGYYAIADFDGDQLPDVATVRAERTLLPFTSYSIHLKFSGTPDSALDLIAPRGGLELLARDVNGDAFTDLVVTTATGSHLVAVLVNDGHGKFTVAKPGTFPGIESEPHSRFSAQDAFVTGQSLLPPSRGNFDAALLRSVLFGRPILSSDGLRSATLHVFKVFLHSRSGRSPPSFSIIA